MLQTFATVEINLQFLTIFALQWHGAMSRDIFGYHREGSLKVGDIAKHPTRHRVNSTTKSDLAQILIFMAVFRASPSAWYQVTSLPATLEIPPFCLNIPTTINVVVLFKDGGLKKIFLLYSSVPTDFEQIFIYFLTILVSILLLSAPFFYSCQYFKCLIIFCFSIDIRLTHSV